MADAPQARKEIRRVLEGYRQPVMVEEFIAGDEVTVGIIGNAPPKLVGMMRILPKKKNGHFVYSVEVKRDYVNLVDYESPPRLAAETLARLEADSLKAFQILGLPGLRPHRFPHRRGRSAVFPRNQPVAGAG